MNTTTTKDERGRNKRRKLGKLSVALTAAAVALGANAALGDATQERGTSIDEIVVKSSTDNEGTQGSAWKDIPEASVTLQVPPGEENLIIARFSATSFCRGVLHDDTGDVVGGGCYVRLLVNDEPMAPPGWRWDGDGDGGFLFDSTNGVEGDLTVGNFLGGSRSVEKSLAVSGYCSNTKPITVKVQFRVTSQNPPRFQVTDWHLTAERVFAGPIRCPGGGLPIVPRL